MFIYETPPIDWFIPGAIKATDAIRQAIKFNNDDDLANELCESELSLMKLLMKCSRELSLIKSSWEGDVRGDNLYIFGMPDPDNGNFSTGVAWKQENNGTTFIFSEFELPWIDLRYLLLTKGATQ